MHQGEPLTEIRIPTVEVGGTLYVVPSALAKARRVTPHAVRLAIRRGVLPGLAIADRWLIPAADAQRWYPSERGGFRPGAGRPRKTPNAA